MEQADAGFEGAKIVILFRGRLLSILRDDVPRIPFPGQWDLPGGGREDDETPEDCALRETREETGLRVDPGCLSWRRRYGEQWFFAARVPDIAGLRLGNEGQALRWIRPRTYLEMPDAIVHLRRRVAALLKETGHE